MGCDSTMYVWVWDARVLSRVRAAEVRGSSRVPAIFAAICCVFERLDIQTIFGPFLPCAASHQGNATGLGFGQRHLAHINHRWPSYKRTPPHKRRKISPLSPLSIENLNILIFCPSSFNLLITSSGSGPGPSSLQDGGHDT